MDTDERRLTGNWDKLFILLIVAVLLCFAWNAGRRGALDKEAILLELDALHHEHCENDEDCDHKHAESHYHSPEHKFAIQHAKEHAKQHELIEKKLKLHSTESHDAHP